MHEIEDLVEDSIRILDKHPEGLDIRSAIWNLYKFQNGYDTHNTFLRCIDILLKHRYFYKINAIDYPNYEKYKSYIDNPKEFYITRYPDKEWDTENNPAAGAYFDEGVIYVEAGSEIWEKLVEVKKFTGKDAEKPSEMNLYELAEKIVEISIAGGNKELAATWYKDGLLRGEFGRAENHKELMQNPHLIKIREMAKTHDLMNVPAFRFTNDMLGEIEEEMDDEGRKLIYWWTFK